MDGVLILVRFVHFSAAMQLFGISVFDGTLAPAELRDRLKALSGRTSAILGLVLAITAMLWFGLETGEAGGGWSSVVDPGTLLAVATDTVFGAAWLWHLGSIVVLLAALGVRSNARRWPTIASAAAVLASLGFVGHAAMEAGSLGWAHRLNHALHLLSAGFWAGCLLPLLLCLLQLRVSERRAAVAMVLERFSGLGHIAVALAVLTGIVNTGLTLGHLPLDFSSPYQALLAAKIGLVAIMVGIALVNRYVVVPRLAGVGGQALRGLVIGTLAELCIGVVVIGLVSAFATFDPA